MLIEVFPQLYERIKATGGLSLWHLFRACDANGSGRVRTSLAALQNIFRVSESSIRRWLKDGSKAGLFDFRYIGRKRIWIRYKSWRKLLREVDLPYPFVGYAPAQYLGQKKITATLLLQLCLQEASFQKAYKEKGFGCRYDGLILKDRRGRNSDYASHSHYSTKLPNISINVKESHRQWVTHEIIEIPGILCRTVKQFRRYTRGGSTSPILYATDRHLCVQAGELTYGASLALAAKMMGCSIRTIQRHHRHPIAQRLGFKKKRLCRGAMDVHFWIKDQFGSYQRAEKHFRKITRSSKKEGQSFADFILSYLSSDPLSARYSLPIYKNYFDSYSKYLEEVNYKPSRMVLYHSTMQKFKIIPITVRYISHHRNISTNHWKTEIVEKRENLLVENLTNIYASHHLKAADHRRYYIKGLKSSHISKGSTTPLCYNSQLASSISINHNQKLAV